MKTLARKTIRYRANRVAAGYDKAAVVQHEVAERLLARLDWIKMRPQRVLDCGARSGRTTECLRDYYPEAELVALELSDAMLAQHDVSDASSVCADYDALPFTNQCFDLVFSHFALPWVNDVATLLAECYRVLRPNGLLMFTSLGPDTLQELRVVAPARIHDFVDMHHLGDALLQQHFEDPVMDMEHLALHYDTVSTLVNDLRNTGVSNARCDRDRGLLTKARWQQFLSDYQQRWQLENGSIPATLELVYGHAWKPQQLAPTKDSTEVSIPVTAINKLPSRY